MVKIKIHAEICKGCGLCIINCPNRLIAMEGPVNKLGLRTAKFIKRDRCKGCALCAIVCPDCAIEVWK